MYLFYELYIDRRCPSRYWISNYLLRLVHGKGEPHSGTPTWIKITVSEEKVKTVFQLYHIWCIELNGNDALDEWRCLNLKGKTGKKEKTFLFKSLLPRVAQIASKSTALDIIFIRFLFLSCHWQWKNLREYCPEEKKNNWSTSDETIPQGNKILAWTSCDHRSLKLRGYWSAGY